MSSAMPGFFNLDVSERLDRLSSLFSFTDDDLAILRSPDFSLDFPTAENMIENCISRHVIPIGVATNFIVDGKEVVIPMATEEASVIAGASLAAKLSRPSGGFTTACGVNICSGQIVFLAPVTDSDSLTKLTDIKSEILDVANTTLSTLTVHSVDIRHVDTMLVIEIHVHVGDSMGATIVTAACEAVKTFVQRKLGFEPLMGILTNLAPKRIVYAQARWPIAGLSFKEYDGFDIANRIIMAANLAKADPTRAATHRKGIMNGICAVCLATGNDTRAVEAAIHSYAALPTSNPALTHFRIDDNSDLVGEIWVPVPVGTVGGSINSNKIAGVMRKMMKIENANDLARTIAAVGLAQNFAALRALVTQGISAGHMKLHSRNIACEAGAVGDEIEIVARELVQTGRISVTAGKAILERMRTSGSRRWTT
jgi:degradative hydroxymethylglutaryl-CoA reductase